MIILAWVVVLKGVGTIKDTMHRSVYIYIPIGSMYGICANIGGILMVNVTIYSIHGSYGIYIYMLSVYDTWVCSRSGIKFLPIQFPGRFHSGILGYSLNLKFFLKGNFPTREPARVYWGVPMCPFNFCQNWGTPMIYHWNGHPVRWKPLPLEVKTTGFL